MQAREEIFEISQAVIHPKESGYTRRRLSHHHLNKMTMASLLYTVKSMMQE